MKLKNVVPYLFEFVRFVILLFFSFKLMRYYSGTGRENVEGVLMILLSILSCLFNFISQIVFNLNDFQLSNYSFLKKQLLTSIIIFATPLLIVLVLTGELSVVREDFLPFALVLMFINIILSGIFRLMIK